MQALFNQKMDQKKEHLPFCTGHMIYLSGCTGHMIYMLSDLLQQSATFSHI